MSSSTPDTLITTYLQMTDPAQFTPAYVADALHIEQMTLPDVPFYRFLYHTVGDQWRWRDRLAYSDDRLREILETNTVYVLYQSGVPAGYVELEEVNGDLEIAYLGLRPAFIGKGLGKHLLSYGVTQAWGRSPQRVWVHTCNLDGEHAIANYQARGFVIYDVQHEPMPEIYQS